MQPSPQSSLKTLVSPKNVSSYPFVVSACPQPQPAPGLLSVLSFAFSRNFTYGIIQCVILYLDSRHDDFEGYLCFCQSGVLSCGWHIWIHLFIHFPAEGHWVVSGLELLCMMLPWMFLCVSYFSLFLEDSGANSWGFPWHLSKFTKQGQTFLRFLLFQPPENHTPGSAFALLSKQL